jgi:hypothetical protein
VGSLKAASGAVRERRVIGIPSLSARQHPADSCQPAS